MKTFILIINSFINFIFVISFIFIIKFDVINLKINIDITDFVIILTVINFCFLTYMLAKFLGVVVFSCWQLHSQQTLAIFSFATFNRCFWRSHHLWTLSCQHDTNINSRNMEMQSTCLVYDEALNNLLSLNT